MDLSEILSLIAGIAAGVLATAVVVRTKILPPLAEAARLTAMTWDDDIIDAVDETLLAVERNLTPILEPAKVAGANRRARMEALDMLGVETPDEEEGEER